MARTKVNSRVFVAVIDDLRISFVYETSPIEVMDRPKTRRPTRRLNASGPSVLPGLARVVAQSGVCDGASLGGLFQEVLDDRNNPFRFRIQGEMARIRDHRELRTGDGPERLHGVVDSNEIAIADHDEHRRFD